MYYRYQGPVTFDQAFNGIAPSSTGPLAPYTVSEMRERHSDRAEPHLQPGTDLSSLSLVESRLWTIAIRGSRATPRETTKACLTERPRARGRPKCIWRDGLSDLDFQHGFHADPRAGHPAGNSVHEVRRRVAHERRRHPALTLRTNTARPGISFGYEPSKLFSMRGDFHSTDNGASYTAISPHTKQAARICCPLSPDGKAHRGR